MKRILAFTMTMLPLACGSEPEPNRRALTAQEQALRTPANDFSFDLLAAVNAENPNENVFLSPLSVSMALGMTLNGAESETEDAMKNVLHLQGIGQTDINEGYRGLIDLLETRDPQVTLSIANSIWYRDTFPIASDFAQVNRDYFDAEVTALDFNQADASQTINQWASDATKGLIPKILEGSISPETIMYLVNAVYFKGDWKVPFEKDRTRPEAFHLADGQTVNVPTMHQMEDHLYLETDAFQMVQLPYGHELLGMTIILPKEGTTIDTIVDTTDSAAWSTYQEQLQTQLVDLALPRVQMSYDIDMKSILSALGMEIAFTDQADLSGMGADNLFISEVKHKTYVDMNEEGTEAAAVTSVGVNLTSAPLNVAMTVDRPFLMVLTDMPSQTILFSGIVRNPS